MKYDSLMKKKTKKTFRYMQPALAGEMEQVVCDKYLILLRVYQHYLNRTLSGRQVLIDVVMLISTIYKKIFKKFTTIFKKALLEWFISKS